MLNGGGGGRGGVGGVSGLDSERERERVSVNPVTSIFPFENLVMKTTRQQPLCVAIFVQLLRIDLLVPDLI